MLPDLNGNNRVAWVFDEDNFDVDRIIGIEYISCNDTETLKQVAMKPFDEAFAETVSNGDVLVGGKNFGYGHPHMPAINSIRALGIKAAFCESFSLGFYRAATSDGFLLVDCPGITRAVQKGDRISYDWEKNELTVVRTGETLPCTLPRKTRNLVEYGGLFRYIKEKLDEKNAG